ncbi:MAG: hypothetical protein RMN51_07995 [Verrucomicrobiota bacterium]|nr:hypothetical protein [Limisphaera sp.]MDW8382029.1 hypothetical protein [Verrucomicrobiota bacterium]
MRSLWLRSQTSSVLPWWRAGLALGVALVADLVQLGLGPLGVLWVDDLLDLMVALIEISLLGFHPFLLPSFVLEVLPGLELMPTWTACVLAVIVRRRHAVRRCDSSHPTLSETDSRRGPVIDI